MKASVFGVTFAGLLLVSVIDSANAGVFGTDTPGVAQSDTSSAPHTPRPYRSTPYGNVIGPAAGQFTRPEQATIHPKAVDVEMGMSCRSLMVASGSRDVESGELATLLDATLSKYDTYNKDNVALPAVHAKLVSYLLYFCKNRPDSTIDDGADYAKNAVDALITKAMNQ